MCKGFVKIPRDFFESGYWCQSRTYNDCEALLDIISQVRFEASEQFARIGGREVVWGQAEWPASVRFLAQRWSWTERHVRTFLSSLKKRGIISTDDSQGVNVIKLLQYHYFCENVGQKIDTPCDTTSDTANNLNISELINQVTQQVTQCLTQQRHSSDTKLNNGNNGNNIIPPYNPPKGESGYDWSVVDENMKPVVEDWLRYKREKKQTYKPTGFKMFCKRLVELSDNDPVKARAIIEDSMANNWAGIFELKQGARGATMIPQQSLDNSISKFDNAFEGWTK